MTSPGFTHRFLPDYDLILHSPQASSSTSTSFGLIVRRAERSEERQRQGADTDIRHIMCNAWILRHGHPVEPGMVRDAILRAATRNLAV